MKRVAALTAALALGAPATAPAAKPSYRFVAKTTLLVTTTSACTAREGGGTTTETLTWEIRARERGFSEVGDGSRRTRGSSTRTGTLRRETSRQFEGYDPSLTPPQGGTDPLQEEKRSYGIVRRVGKRLELGLTYLGMIDPIFAPLAPGKSITIAQNPPAQTSRGDYETTDGGRCIDEERSDSFRRVTLTRAH